MNPSLDLLVEPPDVGVGLLRRLLQLHDRHHRVRVVAEHAHHGVYLVVEEDGAARLELGGNSINFEDRPIK